MSKMQLELRFESPSVHAGGNRFHDLLDRGEFVILVENAAPGRDNDPEAAGERLRNLETAVLNAKYPNCALALTDAYGKEASWRAAEYANFLSPENRDRHVIYLSGKNTSAQELEELIRLAANAGIVNVVPVSGQPAENETARDLRKMPSCESTAMLELLKENKHFTCGCTVNPFEYTSFSLMAEYFKLHKKLRHGAAFITLQAGWDMLKLQSLRWYLLSGSLYYPMIARLIVLTPERVERILAGVEKGISISPEFADILQQELKYSTAQFEAAQYRRIELQAAGCRLMGFSGIQLSGIDVPGRAAAVIDRIGRALKEITTFEQWLEEYNQYLARSEMAPFTGSFFLYDRVLSRPFPAEGEELPTANDFEAHHVSGSEKAAYHLRKFFFSKADRQHPESLGILKRCLAGCRGCSGCILPQNSFICPERCPMHLRDGACGILTPSGNCPLLDEECIHVKALRLQLWRNETEHKPIPLKPTIIRELQK